ncbi:hypothetical protein LINPERHAP1_LOCUS36943, partial [Linum perenne]
RSVQHHSYNSAQPRNPFTYNPTPTTAHQKHCTITIQYTQHTPVTPTHTHTCISNDYLGEFIRRHKEFIPHHPCRPDAPLSPGEVQDASSPLED